MSKRYRVIEHTADAGIKVFGDSLGELFRNSGEALFDLVFGIENISSLEYGGGVEAGGADLEELLVDWLGRLLLKYELEKFIPAFGEVDKINQRSLSARVYGERFNPEKHRPLAEIKGVTYHGLKVEKAGGVWRAEVIFDV
jgi:SHS2 domain-containing protein